MPAVDLLRKKREIGYDDMGDQATAPPSRTLPIAPEESQQFAAMGYQPGQPVNLMVTGVWDGETVSVDSVQCTPPQGGMPQQGQAAPQADPIMRMNPAPVPG